MRAHYFQHVPFEGLGSIETWLGSRGYITTCTRFFDTANLPPLDDVDLLIAMGGPMSVNDEAELPWLATEKAYIRDAIRTGTPVLGICLGAQLIASALGARVYPNAHKEIGWFPVHATDHRNDDAFRFPPVLDAFHWHGETFDLPDGASLLATSPACRNQAFQLGRSTIGLQFHLETIPESARALVANCRDDLTAGPYVQSDEVILSAGPSRYAAINAVMTDVLEYLHAMKRTRG